MSTAFPMKAKLTGPPKGYFCSMDGWFLQCTHLKSNKAKATLKNNFFQFQCSPLQAAVPTFDIEFMILPANSVGRSWANPIRIQDIIFGTDIKSKVFLLPIHVDKYPPMGDIGIPSIR